MSSFKIRELLLIFLVLATAVALFLNFNPASLLGSQQQQQKNDALIRGQMVSLLNTLSRCIC